MISLLSGAAPEPILLKLDKLNLAILGDFASARIIGGTPEIEVSLYFSVYFNNSRKLNFGTM